jgi:hypothetical protein
MYRLRLLLFLLLPLTCLDQKRCFASATEIDSGRVVVTGHWYNLDDIELFDGQKHFTSVKQTTQSRARPFVLRIAKDDVIIFNSTDIHAEPIDTIIVDRQSQHAYLVGNGDNDGRLYVLAIDLTKTPADLTLYNTEPTQGAPNFGFAEDTHTRKTAKTPSSLEHL